jgi:hypothetical protein
MKYMLLMNYRVDDVAPMRLPHLDRGGVPIKHEIEVRAMLSGVSVENDRCSR